ASPRRVRGTRHEFQDHQRARIDPCRVESRMAKVDHWKNSEQKQRWLATALLDLEPQLRRIRNYHALPLLREAIKRQMHGVKKSGVKQWVAYQISTTNGIDSGTRVQLEDGLFCTNEK